jgi:hypothetical protein
VENPRCITTFCTPNNTFCHQEFKVIPGNMSGKKSARRSNSCRLIWDTILWILGYWRAALNGEDNYSGMEPLEFLGMVFWNC